MKKYFISAKRSLIIYVVMLIICQQCAAFSRWVILGDGQERSQEIADVLLARLSENKEMEFVERDLLSEISNEQKISDMLGDKATGNRIKFLDLVKAQRLILISTRSGKTPATVKVIIAESEYGARLAKKEFLLDSQEETIKQVVELTNQVSKHYSDGIKAVVGVASLVSENLEHDYDYLGVTCRNLIESELFLLPGVAVIEMEEAQAIATEIAIGGGNVKNRVTPIMIAGRYEVAKKDKLVSFDIKVTQGKTKIVSVQDKVELKNAASFLKHQVSQVILKKGLEHSKVSVDDQYNWLLKQADDLSIMGFSRRSIGLREAAMLLKSDNVKDILALLSEYQKYFGCTEYEPEIFERDDKFEICREVISRHVSSYITSLSHVEYLIKNRLISREVAADLIYYHSAMRIEYPNKKHLRRFEFWPKLAPILIPAEAAEFKMHKSVMPVFYNLPISDPDNKWTLCNFHERLFRAYAYRADSIEKTPQQLKECAYYFNELFPEVLPVIRDLERFFGRGELNGEGTITSDQWLDFLQELLKSDKQSVRVLAEYATIKTQIGLKKELTALEKDGYITSLRYLRKIWRDLPSRHGTRNTSSFYYDMGSLISDMTRDDSWRKVPFKPTKKKPVSKETLARREKQRLKYKEALEKEQWHNDPSSWKSKGYPEFLGSLRIKELDIQIPRGLANNNPKFVKGTKNYDFLWNRYGVWKLDSRLKLSSVIKSDKFPIWKVIWDGKYLWILSKFNRGNIRHRLIVYNIQGEIITELDDSFSKNDAYMNFVSVKEGTVCVTGTFFPHYRTWLAIASVDNGKITLKEFHHSKEVNSKEGLRSPNAAFLPTWMHVVDNGKKKPKLLLIGRDKKYKSDGLLTIHTKKTMYDRYYPLAVDLSTLEVRVYPYRLGNVGKDNSFFSINGEIISGEIGSFGDALDHWARVGEKWDNGEECKALSKSCRTEKNNYVQGLFVHDGFLHIAGSKWTRYNLETMEPEVMTHGFIPKKIQMQWCGSSDSHGIIGYIPPHSVNPSVEGKYYSITFAKEHLFTEDVESDSRK